MLSRRIAASIAAWPNKRIVILRPALWSVAAAFLVGWAYICWSISFGESVAPADRFTPQDWPYPFAGFVPVGFVYLYVSARVVIDASHVRIRNPFRKVDIPVGHVTELVPGSNMKVVTNYGHFYAWGLETTNLRLLTGRYGVQSDIEKLVPRFHEHGDSSNSSPSRYRFSIPDPLFVACCVVTTSCSVHLFAQL